VCVCVGGCVWVLNIGLEERKEFVLMFFGVIGVFLKNEEDGSLAE